MAFGRAARRAINGLGFNTHGWAYNFISPGLARNHHAHPRPAARTPPASNASARPSHRPAPGPAMARPSPRTGPHTARPARLHDAQPRFHSTHRIRRRNTASPQVAPHALHSGPQIAPARHGPAPLTRITHGPNWGNSLGHVPWLVPYQLAPAAHGTARPARHAHLHDAQPRSHSTHRIRRRNTAPPQVAPDASTQHCTQGPKSPRPGTGPHR